MSAIPETRDDAEYTEEHMHNRERWAGLRVPQTATQWADWATLAPFVIVSGNNTWGASTQIFGTADTPIFTGGKRGDFYRAVIIANTDNSLYRIRIIWDLVSAAAGVAAGRWTEFVFIRDSAAPQRKVFDIMSPKIGAGMMMWCECWNVTNLATISILFGVHEYDF